MKKFSAVITLILVLSLCATALIGCGGTAKAELLYATDGLVVFRINEKMDNATVLDALNYLKEEGKLDFKSETGAWGAYITEVNGVAEVVGATSGKSWMAYSSDPDGSSLEFGSFTYEGLALGQTANGVSTQLVKVGCIYALRLDEWAF